MRFFIQTLGCPKNTVDSEMMAALLRQAGHLEADQPNRADVLIVNTCGFIHDARVESLQALRDLARRKRPRQRLVAAGCLAQRLGAALHGQVPGVDGLIGTRNWREIATLVSHLAQAARPGPMLLQDGDLVASVERRPATGPSAYLKIADGCDAACAFCAIPLIKGPQRSKPVADILREARELAAQGVREIVLIAQDTTAYGRDLGMPDALPGLLREIASAAPTVRWIRLLYAYPSHISPALIETLSTLPQMCHYLDLPLQHGHPDTLRRMRRPHDVDLVVALVSRLRDAMPDIALRSTFIVGFPGETETEFSALLDLLRGLALDKVGVFGYSAEEGTPAALMPGQVEQALIEERRERAMLLQQEISLARNQAQVGRELPVLVEGTGSGLSVGRSYRDAPEIDGLVLIPGELTAGEFAVVRITRAHEYDLEGEAILG